MVAPMHVFLSYNNRDRPVAERICEALKRARPDLDIYFAPERNQVGAYWMDLLGQELAESDAVILLLGERVGDWQEIEYYDALKRNRKAGRPLIAPIALAERLPGLPFLDHFHRLIFDRHPFDELIAQAPATREAIEACRGTAMVLGTVVRAPAGAGSPIHNSAIVVDDGRVVHTQHKTLLPTYDVFDEGRYFRPGSSWESFELGGRRVGALICEDLWNDPEFWSDWLEIESRFLCLGPALRHIDYLEDKLRRARWGMDDALRILTRRLLGSRSLSGLAAPMNGFGKAGR